MYDPMREKDSIHLLWMKIHSLTLELWLEMELTMIRNRLGMMLDVDEETHSLDRTSMVKICVELNMGDGLNECTDI